MKNTKKENNPTILFVTEKWCDAQPSKGLTNSYHNLFKTYENVYPNSHFDIVHFDEYSLMKKKHIDDFLIKIVKNKKPEIVIFSLLHKSHLNPSDRSYSAIKEQGCKTIFIWADIGPDWGIPMIDDLNQKGFSDLHVCWAREKNINKKYSNLLWLWTPEDDHLYYPSEEEQDIPMSFLGSKDRRYEERIHYLNYLKDNEIDCYVGGGQRESKLSPRAYADIIRRSKITLNFPRCTNGYDQLKGRVLEALASKSLVFERKNDVTSEILKPGTHYVEYTSPQDLIEKYHYYLENEEERSRIVQNGYEIYREKYNAKNFWDQVLKGVATDG